MFRWNVRSAGESVEHNWVICTKKLGFFSKNFFFNLVANTKISHRNIPKFMKWTLSEMLQLFSDLIRSSPLEVFLRKSFLKICSKYTGEHPCQGVISINLESNFIEFALWHGCSLVKLLHIFRTPFSRNTSEWLKFCWGSVEPKNGQKSVVLLLMLWYH